MSFVFEILNMFSNVTSTHESPESTITKLYIECTIALLMGLVTIVAAYKILPYIASFLSFFVKFCLCMLLLSFTIHLFKHSELIQAVARLMSYARDFSRFPLWT
jgi:hypothetical protein